jgi:hypothetical protein
MPSSNLVLQFCGIQNTFGITKFLDFIHSSIFYILYSMAQGSTQPLTEMSTRNLTGAVKGCRCVRLTNSPRSLSRLSRENVGASTSHNPIGLHGQLQGRLYLFLYNTKVHNVSETGSLSFLRLGGMRHHSVGPLDRSQSLDMTWGRKQI